MKDENRKSPCNFGADAAAFIYNELKSADREKFESHLSRCENCAAEIADFNFLRDSIQQWKTSEFDILPMPVFTVPLKSEITEAKPTLFDKIRAFINFAPAVSAGLAVVLVAIIGFGWFILHNNSAIETASSVARQPEIAPENLTAETVKTTIDSTDSTSAAQANSAADENLIADENNSANKTAPKIIKSSVSKIESEKPRKTDSNKSKAVVKAQLSNKKSFDDNQTLQARKLPRLNNLPDEEEADDLRLADLFTESDSK